LADAETERRSFDILGDVCSKVICLSSYYCCYCCMIQTKLCVCYTVDDVSTIRPLICLTVWFLGSPFLVAIGGEPSGRVTERIVRQKEAADVTHIGSQCELSLKIPGTRCSAA